MERHLHCSISRLEKATASGRTRTFAVFNDLITPRARKKGLTQPEEHQLCVSSGYCELQSSLIGKPLHLGFLCAQPSGLEK